MKKALATNLRKARMEKKWPQRVMAEFLGLKIPSYQAYEEGRSEPSSDRLVRIAEIFEIENLLGFIKDPDFDLNNQCRMPPIKRDKSPLESNYAKLRGTKRQAVDILLGIRKVK